MQNYTQLNVRETTTYKFGSIEKHRNGKNKPTGNEDGQGWRRLTRIANDQLDKFRLNFLRCTNRDIAPLTIKQLYGTLAGALKVFILQNNPSIV